MARFAPADDCPVVRAGRGDIGMYFRFGGLATLAHSNNQRTVGPLIFNQVGMKFVFSERLMLPVRFGTGVRVDSTSVANNTNTATNWGIDLGVGLEYHFRIWRRVSPFIGGGFGLDIEDPTGGSNVRLGIGFGPVIGIEYYIGDRVSLAAQYMFVIQIAYQDAPAAVTTFGMSTLAGGAVTYHILLLSGVEEVSSW